MNKTFFNSLWIAGSMLSVTASEEPPQVASGTIERLSQFHSSHVDDRNVDIWLPEGYDPNGSQRYQVLYMHDGQMLFDASKTWNGQEWEVDETMSLLIREKQIQPTIVVGVWNVGDNRWPDYCPQTPFEMLPRAFVEEQAAANSHLGRTSVQSDPYLKFLVTELKPYIDAHYLTLPGKDTTFVAGSSMGGLISMYAICEYPSVFGGAACLSTHWPGANPIANNPFPDVFLAYLKIYLPDPKTHKIYFDHGTETLDAHYGITQQRVDEVMKIAGFDSTHWMTRVFKGTDHSENAWKARFQIPVLFLMEK